jgi:FKBP-type peptidyl-prolyl cis-trans isomerase
MKRSFPMGTITRIHHLKIKREDDEGKSARGIFQKGESMNLKLTVKWIVILGIGFLTTLVTSEETLVLKTEREKVSYGIGVEMARNLKKQGIEVDLKLVVKGFTDGLDGVKLLLSEEDLRKTNALFQAGQRQVQRDVRRMALDSNKNKKEGEAFLEENKRKEGVVTLPSGLQYMILRSGDGKKPMEDDTVEVHYRGTLINGSEFDSSYRVGKPAILKVTGVISGWREALKLMTVGSKWKLFIPAELAYGERGAGRYIGPNAALIFEVELMSIK